MSCPSLLHWYMSYFSLLSMALPYLQQPQTAHLTPGEHRWQIILGNWIKADLGEFILSLLHCQHGGTSGNCHVVLFCCKNLWCSIKGSIPAKSTKIIVAYLFDRWWFGFAFTHLWFNKGNKTCFSHVFLGEDINMLSVSSFDKMAVCLHFCQEIIKQKNAIYPYVG